MKKFTKTTLAKELRIVGLSFREAHALVTIILERTKAAIKRGQVVEFRGFGTFTPMIKNVPMNFTKEKKTVPTKVVRFKAATNFKSLIKEDYDPT